MIVDVAIEKAVKDIASLNPLVAADKAGCDFREEKFHLKYFNRLFLIDHASGTIEEPTTDGHGPALSRALKLVLLHYLINASGAPIAGEWITYRYLPGANFFESRFESMGILPLQRRFGKDLEGFRQACRKLGSDTMSRTGDAAYRFLAFPNVPMGCILYLADEEMPPSVTLLFDASAPNYLPTEDLSYVGSYLAFTLIKLAPNKVESAADTQGDPRC